jgi:hypothetical protein
VFRRELGQDVDPPVGIERRFAGDGAGRGDRAEVREPPDGRLQHGTALRGRCPRDAPRPACSRAAARARADDGLARRTKPADLQPSAARARIPRVLPAGHAYRCDRAKPDRVASVAPHRAARTRGPPGDPWVFS